MMRRLLLLSAVMGIFFVGSLMAQVSVTTKIPSAVVPGSEFNVELKISKGDVAGFAKLQQELPTGFEAIAGETANSTFTFKDRKVKFLWMSLPSTPDIVVNYKVKVDKGVSGSQFIEGNFSYIRNNETEKFIMPKDIIMVSDDQQAASQNAAAAKSMEDQRKREEAAEAARAEASKREQEQASSVSSEAAQSSDNSSESNNDSDDQRNVEEEERRVADAQRAKEQQASSDREAKRAQENADRESQRAQQAQANAEKEARRKEQQAAASQKSSSSFADAMLKTKPGLVFRVQIAAGPHRVDPSVLASKYGISEAISVEEHDGLNKYIVGEFGSYRPAKTFCNELRDNNSVEGPFVTAYNNGVRIHVKEALDIAGQ